MDGQVVETPRFKVLDQAIQLDPQARLDLAFPVTLLLHKPAGYGFADQARAARQLLLPGNRAAKDRSGVRVLQRHFVQQICVTPLETEASGLLVFTQDYAIRRKLLEEAALVENEVIVEVTGAVTAAALHRLNRAPVIDGRAMVPAKVSLNNQTEAVTGLRFAVKACFPGQIAHMCKDAGLTVVGMKRIRVGRVPMAGLAPGQWRYLMAHERF